MGPNISTKGHILPKQLLISIKNMHVHMYHAIQRHTQNHKFDETCFKLTVKWELLWSRLGKVCVWEMPHGRIGTSVMENVAGIASIFSIFVLYRVLLYDI